jgi:hypothetical protein
LCCLVWRLYFRDFPVVHRLSCWYFTTGMLSIANNLFTLKRKK